MAHEDADLEAPLPASAGPLLVLDVTVMCGAGAQMHAKSYCDSSDPLSVHHALADKLMAVVNRQRAIGELPDMEAELAAEEAKLANAIETERLMLPRREAGVKERQARIKLAEEAVANDRKAREIQWSQRRQGPYKPSSADDAAIRQLISEVQKAEHEAEAATNEEKAAEELFKTNCGVVQKKIDGLKSKIAEAKALIDGG